MVKIAFLKGKRWDTLFTNIKSLLIEFIVVKLIQSKNIPKNPTKNDFQVFSPNANEMKKATKENSHQNGKYK